MQISFLYDAAAPFLHALGAAAGAVGDDGSAAGDGFQVGGRVIVLVGRVEEDVGSGINLGQFSYVVRSLDADNVFRKVFHLLVIQTHEDNAYGVINHVCQSEKVLQSFPRCPWAGDAQDEILPREAMRFFEITGRRMKNVEINPIMDYTYIVHFQEGLFHDVRKPLGRRHDVKSSHPSEKFFL